jgi:hypothetical protein
MSPSTGRLIVNLALAVVCIGGAIAAGVAALERDGEGPPPGAKQRLLFAICSVVLGGIGGILIGALIFGEWRE